MKRFMFKTVTIAILAFTTSANAESERTSQSSLEDYALFVSIKIKSGMENKYSELVQSYLKKVHTETGIRTYKVHQSVDDSSMFEIYAHFDSKNAHEAHLAQQHTKDYLTDAKPLFEVGYPQRRKFQEVR